MPRLENRRASRRLTRSDAIQIHKLLRQGVLQSRIAAKYDVNGGRISEINTGKKFPGTRNLSFE